MNWPTHSDYQDAIQNPGLCFQEGDLKAGSAATDMLGLPRVMSGNFASVYELQCDGKRWAVRCFVRQVPGQQGRYSRLSQHLNNLTMPYLVKFEYMLKGILVKGEWYPIVKMQWVDGVPLNTFIEEHVNEPQVLLKLADDWRAMMKTLASHRLAHGDLQHGNVMVTPNAELRLVDYDGMFAPVFGRGRAPELGHLNFQHPRRTADFYQEDLDNFSALVIYTSLRAIAAGPALFQKYYTVDNLILSSGDFKNPLNSPVFAALKQSKDAAVQQLAKLLERCCTGPVECVPDFGKVMTALDAGTSLETVELKAASPPASLSRPVADVPGSRPAAEAAETVTGTKKSEPAPAVAAAAGAARNATRSAYDNVPTAKSTQASTFPSKQTAPQNRPSATMPVSQSSSGVPPWIWAVAGAAVVAIVSASFVFMKSSSHSGPAPTVHETPASPPVAAAAPAAVEPKPPTESPVTTAPIQRSDNVKLTVLGTLRGHNGSVDAVKYSPDGLFLASASADKSVRLWDAQSGEPKRTLMGAGDGLIALAISPDSKTVAAVAADNTVLFWDAVSGQLQKSLDTEKNNLFPVAISSDTAMIATGSSDRKAVRIVSTANGSTIKVLPNHSSWIRSVSFSADGKLVAVVCHDDSINIWNLTTGQLLHMLSSPGNVVDAPAFSSDNRFLAAGGENRDAKVWDLQTGVLHQTFSDHSGDVKTCVFSPDRRWLVTGSADKTAKVWEVFTGQLKQTLANYDGTVNSVAFSPDGSLLASGAADQRIKLWQVSRPK